MFSPLWTLCCPLQVKYKEAGQKELPPSLFSTLPQTLHTQVVKEVTELQSQVTDHGRHFLPTLFVFFFFIKLFHYL